MPKQEENYGLNKLDLIRSGTEETQFDSSAGDYIRLTLYRSDTDIFVDRFYSNQNTISGEEQVETYSAGGFVGVKPNEILETNFVAGGNYRLQFDFLRNVFDNWSNSWETPKFVIIKKIIADKKSPAALNLMFWQKYLETKPINNILFYVFL